MNGARTLYVIMLVAVALGLAYVAVLGLLRR
ncbi:hypothetical protein MPTA5024_03655 [Microbispora sp. ATCC PTA-5024]|nr:hypothetical protein MPTA5024_03655 [Microbispora sp. ATCC PTA-5024]